ncbi:MAG TPA: nucleotidyltransferase domain-containing protein [Actinocrinis sp.]|nr:nucleotidyltransferase domain-containing protein [Actinocrinis sp.]
MADIETEHVLAGFVAAVRPVVPVLAVWAHGSLAMGDFQPGRSDLDLVAVIEAPLDGEQRDRLESIHRRLSADEPAAAKLHCSYMVAAALDDAETAHVTWAHDMFLERPVTPVSRRELLSRGLVLHGPAPAELIPPVSDRELARYILRDLREFWLPATGRALRRLEEIWVDLGLPVAARASVTLRDGRLITKGEALAELTALGAPADVVDDICQRRYAADPPRPGRWRRVRRGLRARAFIRREIERILGSVRTGAPGLSSE